VHGATAAVLVLSITGLLGMSDAAAQQPGELVSPTVRVEVSLPEQEAGGPVSRFFSRVREFLGVRKLVRIRPAPGTKLVVTASAYAPSAYQTDSTPCITASGTRVRPGVVASNFLPLGTLLEINGERYIVEDRMNSRFNGYYMDMWFPSTSDALEFGRRKLEVTVVGYGVPGQDVREEEHTQPQADEAGLETEDTAWDRTKVRFQIFNTVVSNIIRAQVRSDVDRYDIDCLREAGS
jgi:3D (Asp-Asp-Asp) domain-containing protein